MKHQTELRAAVYDDRIEVEVRQLPRELAMAHPSIHGPARHDVGYTDGDHASAEEYQAGRADG